MKMISEFVIKGSPSTVTAQQKGLRIVRGHAHYYEKREVSEAKKALKEDMLQYVPDEPVHGDVFVRIMWLFTKQSLRKSEHFTFKRSRPDLDNLSKSVLDCMTDLGFWDDDSQVVKEDLTKAWNIDYPGLFIQVYELEEGDYDILVNGWRNSYEG